jgi:DNA-binding FrmR family transcriptional regulator
VLKRLNFIEATSRIRRMIEADKSCVDVLKQTYAVRRAIEKMEAIMLAGHLHTCVVEGIRDGREDAVLAELSELYEMAGR